jgi:hypothetical protein
VEPDAAQHGWKLSSCICVAQAVIGRIARPS